MYAIGDKVILCKELGTLYVGKTYEIGGFQYEGFIIRSEDTKTAVMVLTEDEIKNYFKPVNMKVWTDWTMLGTYCGVIEFRTNHKKVQVRDMKGHLKAEACCNKVDVFSLSIGLNIALLRLKIKQLNEERFNLIKKILTIDKERTRVEDELREIECKLKNVLEDKPHKIDTESKKD